MNAESEQPQRDRTEIPRHKQWGGPLVLPANHRATPGNKVCDTCGRSWKGKCPHLYYKRTTGFIDVIQNEYSLKQWDRRLVAYGMGQRPDLVLAATTCKPPHDKRNLTQADKSDLQAIADKAKEFAKGDAAARVGTSLHKLTQFMDEGQTLGYVPEDWRGDLRAYEEMRDREQIEYVDIEVFRVHDEFKVAGTADRFGYVRSRTDKLRVLDVKGLALTTLLPTPTGWTTMGDIRIGQQVLGSNGHPCTVTIKSDTKRIGTFIVSFDDGTKVVCDTEHIWWTTSLYERNHNIGPTPKSISEIVTTLTDGRQNQHCVPVVEPLELPDVELPIDPYVLGAWLGDGQHDRNVITKADDLFGVIESDGHLLGKRQIDRRSGCVTRTVLGLMRQLREAHLLGHKHIPDTYLRASYIQRLRLLQGLMDTDGTWNTARRRACFNSTDKSLAHQVHELLLTLGQRPHLSSIDTTGFGKDVTSYAVEFLPVDMEPFRLPRKKAKAVAQKPVNPTRARRRVIVDVQPGPDVETACIGVDSSNHTYLCSEQFVPTHNTGDLWGEGLGQAMQLAMYARMLKYDIAWDRRVPDTEEVDLNVGYIIHMVERSGQCELIPVDIAKGWNACQTAKLIWEHRNEKGFFLKDDLEERAASRRHVPRTPPSYVDMASRAGTLKECKLLWRNAKDQGELTDELKTMLIERADFLKAAG